MNNNKYKVKARDLVKRCNPAIFKFESTAEIQPLKAVIGQDRALNALSFGIDIDNPGYNIYLAGAFGTGKSTLAREVLEDKARQKRVPSDWCYVYNYKDPDSPKALKLPGGKGKVFKKDIAIQIEKSIRKIVKAFESDDFDYKKNAIVSEFVEETNKMYLQLDEEARSYGFTISRNQNSVNTVPLKNGEVLTQEGYLALSEQEREELNQKNAIVQEKLNAAFRQYKEIEKTIKTRVRNLEHETARAAIAPYYASLFDKYRIYKDLVEYLEDMQQDMLDHIDVFVGREDDSAAGFFRYMNKRASLRRYEVNLIVDNSQLEHAPVVFETNPTFANLFGQIEYEGEFGILATDFSKIKAGAIHKANGGFLVLQFFDIVKNFYIWDTLKRVLKNQEIVVENASRMLGISNTETLEPEAIPVNIKVILIGEPIYYYLLYSYDEEFRKLFKIRADFDSEMDRSRKHVNEYAQFISCVCQNEDIRHLNPSAVAMIVDYSSRMAGDKNKLSTLFNKLVEVIYEANCWAERQRSRIISAEHIKQALKEKKYRSSLLEGKIQEHIKKDSIIINVSGEKIGELNALAVYETGDYSFGKPVRVTAKTFMGEKGLVNIEREIRLSGTIHSKGVLTLNGYLGAQYAQDKPLSLSASLTFEQSYQGIEGDSASSAELFALLSSLAEVPVKQGIAVTGSVNQNGEIQPVGGINQKIEGFFKVCKDKGFDGKQGVIIPVQNVSQLMLDEEVIEAVKSKKFNVWAIAHIDEGLQILCGLPAGKKNDNGGFESGSVHYFADKKLRDWSKMRKYPGGSRVGQSETKVKSKRRRGC